MILLKKINENLLSNKKWCVIGDSLNEFNQTASKNWIKWMIEKTNVSVTNLAQGGTGFVAGRDTNNNYINIIPQIPSDSDFITIAMSINDIANVSIDVGTHDDTGNTTICGYINSFFDELLKKFPLKSLGVYTTSPWKWYRPHETKTQKLVDELKWICAERGIPFSDECFYNSGLRPWDDNFKAIYYYNSDGVHPNNLGHKFLYTKLKDFINSLVINYN